ncbi:MAG: hypothetical protein C0518_06365 [Opitutus sp.]|nr:hypothetical protein [Opitutus sp.]
MAWRLDEHVIRGEIDNRTRGRTTGRIWFAGRTDPVELALDGNCWRDLAGRRLEFVNPEPKPGLPESFAARQQGAVGDITASRKVKVPDIPLDDLHLYYKTGREMPWHWGNSLYLEWVSARNGRVVIETASFELKIVGEPAWEMSEAEEQDQRRANAAALDSFMARMDEALAQRRERKEQKSPVQDDEAAPGNAGEPMTEEEADQMQARSNLLADRIEVRMAREREEADYGKILEEEIERLNREFPPAEPTPEQLARNAAWLEEFNRGSDEAAENPDAEIDDEPCYEHPLAGRAAEIYATWRELAEAEHWLPEDAVAEHPVQELLHALRRASVKLTVALNGEEWPPDLNFCAIKIVQLKKTREYLDDALRALESFQEEKLVPPTRLGPLLIELIDLAHDADELIAELRERLERGTD